MNFEREMRDLSLLLCTISLVVGFISCDNVKSKEDRSGSSKSEWRSAPETVEISDTPAPPVRITRAVQKEKSRIEADNSLVETMFDNYGNKTESRYFNSNPLLKMVVRRTRADGQTEAVIYAQNGDIRTAPPELAETIMKSPAKEIARAADITEGTIQNEIPAMLAAQKPTPDIEPFPLTESLSSAAQTPLVKTEMLSDQIIKPDEKTTKRKSNDEDVKPYDIPEN